MIIFKCLIRARVTTSSSNDLNFRLIDDNNKSYVAKQPQTPEEIECAKQAEAACPVMVIHVEEDSE
jgi:ferredoxin